MRISAGLAWADGIVLASAMALPSSMEPKESLLGKATSSENGEKIRAILVESARQLD
jgi:hypothetical protein